MSNLPDERRGTLAAQLWRHKMVRPEGEPMTWCVCLCWSTARGALADDERAHNSHVADALAPMLAGWLTEAWDEGKLSGLLGASARTKANPYRHDTP